MRTSWLFILNKARTVCNAFVKFVFNNSDLIVVTIGSLRYSIPSHVRLLVATSLSVVVESQLLTIANRLDGFVSNVYCWIGCWTDGENILVLRTRLPMVSIRYRIFVLNLFRNIFIPYVPDTICSAYLTWANIKLPWHVIEIWQPPNLSSAEMNSLRLSWLWSWLL